MLKHLALLTLTILLSAELSPTIAQSSSSNPIMVIRCRFQSNVEVALKGSNQKVEERVIDECPEGTELEPITFYNGTECIPICFDGALEMDFPLLDCSTAQEGVLIETTVCFTSTDPATPLQVGQYVAFDAIENCLNDGGDSWLVNFLNDPPLGYNPTYDETGFGPAINDAGTVKVCAIFHVDPARATLANVISDANPSGTSVSAIPCPSLSIPTMGQWGLFILGLLTSCIALSFMAQRTHKTV